jgi:hypothetical protein
LTGVSISGHKEQYLRLIVKAGTSDCNGCANVPDGGTLNHWRSNLDLARCMRRGWLKWGQERESNQTTKEKQQEALMK